MLRPSCSGSFDPVTPLVAQVRLQFIEGATHLRPQRQANGAMQASAIEMLAAGLSGANVQINKSGAACERVIK